MTENLKFEMFIENLNIRYHGMMARGLSPRTLRDFTYFRRNRICKASKVCLLKLFRYSPFNPRRTPPIRDLIKIHTVGMLIMEALLFTFI